MDFTDDKDIQNARDFVLSTIYGSVFHGEYTNHLEIRYGGDEHTHNKIRIEYRERGSPEAQYLSIKFDPMYSNYATNGCYRTKNKRYNIRALQLRKYINPYHELILDDSNAERLLEIKQRVEEINEFNKPNQITLTKELNKLVNKNRRENRMALEKREAFDMTAYFEKGYTVIPDNDGNMVLLAKIKDIQMLHKVTKILCDNSVEK